MALAQGNKFTLVPPPTSGLNFIDPLMNMNDSFALYLRNIKPEGAYSPCRDGITTVGSSATPPRSQGTLMGLTKADGTFVMLLINSNNLSAYSITTTGTFALVAASGCPPTGCEFRNRLFLAFPVGGLVPRDWDGTTYTATAWVTPGGFALTELASPWAYRGRLYFIRYSSTNSTSIYYAGLDAVTGALTELPLASQLLRGGYCYFGGSFSSTPGADSEIYNVVVSNMGEVLIFSGADPASSDWRLLGRFFIAPPASGSSFFYNESDFYIITKQGTVSCRDLLNFGADKAKTNSITKYIDPEISKSAILGWSLGRLRTGVSPSENLLYLFSINSSSGSDELGFFVQNLITKAWSFYIAPTGLTAATGVVSDPTYGYYAAYDNNLMYLVKVGINDQKYDSIAAVQTAIPWRLRHAYINQGQINKKKYNKIRPFLTDETAPAIASFVDFEETSTSQVVAMSATMNKKYYDINREGVFISVQLSGSANSTALTQYHGTLLSYQLGSDVP